MSFSELVAPYVAFPMAGFLMWLAFGDLLSRTRRRQLVDEWKRRPGAMALIYLAGVSLAVFFVWIGTHGDVGSIHFGWISLVSLIAGLSFPRSPRRS